MMKKLISAAVERGAESLHIKAGDVFRARIHGDLVRLSDEPFTPVDTRRIAMDLLPTDALRERIDEIYDYDFVRLDEGDPLAMPYLIQANYFEDGYVYLLNARPGRYAAVAASSRTKGGATSEFIAYFPAEAIEQTIVELEPGRVALVCSPLVLKMLTFKRGCFAWRIPINCLRRSTLGSSTSGT